MLSTAGEKMKGKPKIYWSRWIKRFLCHRKVNPFLCEVGFGKSIPEAYENWKLKQESLK
jgi:hypothetical protein